MGNYLAVDKLRESGMNLLEKYHIGKLIIYNSLPYQVMDIDFDDVSLLLGDGEIGEFWVEISEL